MNLRDLHYLVSVADNLHFGKAAEICHVSQPTLSIQLKKLEETLGVQIFERNNKQVMLTKIGEELTQYAKNILAEAAQMKQAAKAAKDPFTGDLRMGIFPTLAPYLLPHLMPLLKSNFPRLNLLLVEEKTAELIEQLQYGKLDCALLAMPIDKQNFDNPDFVHKKLFTEDFLLAVSSNHALAKHQQVQLDDIKNETMLLLDEGHCLREQTLEVCHLIGSKESENFRATSLETLRHMVSASNAITLIPQLAVRYADNMAYIPFQPPAPARNIGLYWRKTSARQALFTAFAALDFATSLKTHPANPNANQVN